MSDREIIKRLYNDYVNRYLKKMILKYKPIPKWLDVSIAVVFLIFTMYAAYDTFIN